MPDTADVAIVGGGLAGSALAIRLAEMGISCVVLERQVEPEWTACGVFTSPLTKGLLIDLGVTAARIDELSRPISALRLESTRGVSCRIEYEHGSARGLDRPTLDAVLLGRAREAGADVRSGIAIRSMNLPESVRDHGWLTVAPTVARKHGDTRQLRARLIVGADGSGSMVAGRAGVNIDRSTRSWRAGFTCQRRQADAPEDGRPIEGRFVFGQRWYAGVVPVPGKRVNIGIVHPGHWLSRPMERLEQSLTAQFPGPRRSWMSGELTDAHRARGVLEHSVLRVAGDGFVLVGDAAGFIDPLSGEGIHRALVSTEMAAEAIGRWLSGERNALREYDRRYRAHFLHKDVVSWILQTFLAQPRLMDYALRRLAARGRQRRTLTLVLTDQVRATRALDPRFLARLLMP